MEESGVSKVITIKLEENGKIILPEPEPFEEEDVPPETEGFCYSNGGASLYRQERRGLCCS